MKLVLWSVALASLLNTTNVFADEDLSLELAELQDLLGTNLATNTRPKDPDLAPGIVQIITQRDIERSGAQTVADAIALIPGLTYQGLYTSPIVRGIGGSGSTASGKIKFQLNGRQFNEPATATDAGLLELRTAAIQRIEVIRGPGSAVHGEYALSAVINVITKEDKEFIVGGGSGNSRYANVAFHHFFGESSEVSLVAGVDRQDGQEVDSGPDLAALISAFVGQPNSGNAPGPVYDPRDNQHLIFSLKNELYDLDIQYLDHKRGPYFGFADILVADTDRPLLNEKNVLVGLSAEYDLGASFEWDLGASYAKFDREFSDYGAYPVGFLGIFQNGATSNSNESLQTLKLSSQVTWYSGQNAITALGMSYTDISADEADLRANFNLVNQIPGLGLPGPSPVFIDYPIGFEGRNRYISSAFLQQELFLLQNLNLTVGGHYDRYSDVDDNFSPRVALVWDFDEKHILKASLAEAFRAPTFVELYNITSLLTGAADIKPETVRTTELTYIYRSETRRFEVSIFDSKYDDVIASGSAGGFSSSFTNLGSFDSSGVEVMFEQSLSSNLQLEGFVAYQNSEDSMTGESFQGTSEWLGSLAANYQFGAGHQLSLRYFYVGERTREVFDPRSPLDGYETVNVNLKLIDIMPNTSLTLTAHNLFDEEVVQPALLNTYPNDYPREGRSLFANLAYRF